MSFLNQSDNSKSTQKPLTDIVGVGAATADKLTAVGIDTIEKVAKVEVTHLIGAGLSTNQAERIQKEALRLIEKEHTPDVLHGAEPVPAGEEKIRAVILNGVEVPVTDKDYANADLTGYDIIEYMSMTPDTKARVLRIAHSKLPPEENITDTDELYGAEDFELGTMEAGDFLKQRRRNEIIANKKKGVQARKLAENTTKFVADNVHGQELPNNLLSQEGDQTEQIYIPNQRNKTPRKRVKKDSESSVQAVLDNLFGDKK